MADQIAHQRQGGSRVVDPAMQEIAVQQVERVGGQGGEPRQLGVGAVVAGEQCERGAVGLGGDDQLLDPVRPVAAPAQQPDDHQPGMGQGLLDIEVDRERMLQLEQVGEPERRLGRG